MIARKNLFAFQQKSRLIKNDLEQTEKNIGKTAKNIKQSNRQLSLLEQQLRKTQTLKEKDKEKLKLQQNLLSEQTRAIYLLGRQPYLKIILNQQDPAKISRYLKYYAALNQARLHAILSIKQTTLALKSNEKMIHTKTNQQEEKQKQLEKQHEKFTQEKSHRKKLLRQTKDSIQSQNDKLAKLLHDKKQLENIITSLKAQKPLGYNPGATFQQMRKKLIWPIDHTKVIQRYGKLIAYGRLKSTGILLRAKLGEPVHAIFPGRVIFANWLNGFGMLVIVQHGKNYMTLYARNQSLYVKKGEIIRANEVIATAGNSGGFQSTALYFEIRYKGKPLNPLKWLR